MTRSRSRTGRLLVTLLGLWLAAGCIAASDRSGATDVSSSSAASPSATTSCSALLSRAVALKRAGQAGEGRDLLTDAVQTLSDGSCPRQWALFQNLGGTNASATSRVFDPCAGIRRDLGREFEAMLRDRGLCARDRGAGRDRRSKATADPLEGTALGEFLATAAPDAKGQEPEVVDGLAWDRAIDQVGSSQRVCGPLAGIGSSQDDVFLNLGRDYPDPSRFTVVLWDVGGIEPFFIGSTLCVSGSIVNYEGVAQIQVYSRSAVEDHG